MPSLPSKRSLGVQREVGAYGNRRLTVVNSPKRKNRYLGGLGGDRAILRVVTTNVTLNLTGVSAVTRPRSSNRSQIRKSMTAVRRNVVLTFPTKVRKPQRIVHGPPKRGTTKYTKYTKEVTFRVFRVFRGSSSKTILFKRHPPFWSTIDVTP